MLGYYVKVGHVRFFSYPFQLTVHSQLPQLRSAVQQAKSFLRLSLSQTLAEGVKSEGCVVASKLLAVILEAES
jgi:hypothetical protein